MQLISFNHNDKASFGVLDGEQITDLGPTYGDLRSLLEEGLETLSHLELTNNLGNQRHEVERLLGQVATLALHARPFDAGVDQLN